MLFFAPPDARIDGLTALAHRADDIIMEENDVVQLALKRLSPKEAYDRVYRLRRALQVPAIGTDRKRNPAKVPQCSVSHQLLPKEEWTKPEEVIRNPMFAQTPY